MVHTFIPAMVKILHAGTFQQIWQATAMPAQFKTTEDSTRKHYILH